MAKFKVFLTALLIAAVAAPAAAGPSGTLHPNLTVAADGTVTAVDVETDTIGDDAFAEAVRKEILTWKMPASTWNRELGLDLEFDPARDLYGVDAEIEE